MALLDAGRSTRRPTPDVHGATARVKMVMTPRRIMREPGPTADTGDEISERDGASASHALGPPARQGRLRALGKRLEVALSGALELFARRAHVSTDDAS